MKKVRIIHYANESGSKEGVYFSDFDFDTPADDFIPPGCTLQSDTVIEARFPSGFPFEYNLEK